MTSLTKQEIIFLENETSNSLNFHLGVRKKRVERESQRLDYEVKTKMENGYSIQECNVLGIFTYEQHLEKIEVKKAMFENLSVKLRRMREDLEYIESFDK